MSYRLLFALALSLTATAAEAQTCPAYPPEVDTQTTKQTLIFVGANSGCTNAGAPADSLYRCSIVGGDTFTFSILTAPGRPIQDCDVLTWDFGDGTKTTSTGMEPVSHTYVVPSWFSIEYQANVIITNSLRTGIGASNHAVAGFLFILPPCDAHNIAVQKITQTFNGPKSGCTQLAGTCAVGEPINFAIAAAEPTADPCDYWFVDWGDGTRPETFIIGDPTAQISPHHFFATTGKFVATFTLQPTGTRLSAESIAQVLPSASATVYVTPTGSPAGGKRRSVRP